MPKFIRAGVASLAIASLAIAIVLGGLTHNAVGQLSNGDIIISEFFNDVFQIDPVNRTQTNIFNQDLFLGSIAGTGNFAYSLDNGEGIVEINLSTGMSSLIAGSTTSVNELTLDQNDNLIVAGGFGVQRFDRSTGVFSTITGNTYDDIVVSAQGDIFVVDAFDGIGRLDSGGNFDFIADPGFAFEGLTIGTDGLLYSYSNFDGLFQIDPITGESTMLEADIFGGFDDMVSFEDGALLISGTFDIDGDSLDEDGLFRYDLATGAITSVFDEATDDISFWSPTDVYIVGELNAVVPEPCSAFLLSSLSMLMLRRRRSKLIS